MKPYKILFVLLTFCFFISCNEDLGRQDVAISSEAVAMNAPVEVEKIDVSNQEQKLIKRGSIHFETKSVTKSQDAITELVKKHNGYVSNQNQNNYGDRLTYTLQARIPATDFDTFFQELLQIAERVVNQSVQVEDVTQEFIDVEARIATKKELEKRYLALLDKATGVEDMLKIERELGTLRSDIESMEARLKYLQSQTDYSTLEISFFETNTKDFGFLSKFTQALVNGWQALLSFIIGLVTLWPFFLILAMLIYLLRRYKIFNRK